MSPAAELQWVKYDERAALAFWQGYDASAKVDLSCAAVRVAKKLVFIDPIPLAEAALQELTADSSPEAVVLTNGNHQRAAASFSKRFNIPVFAHPEAIPELSLGGIKPLEENSLWRSSVTVIPLPGAAAGEVALYWKELGGVLCMGDALINLEATGFSFLPEKYCDDATQLRESARKLQDFDVKIITFAHGLPLTVNTRKRLEALVS